MVANINEKAVKHFTQKVLRTMEDLPTLEGPVVQWLSEFEDDSRIREKSWYLDDGIPTVAQTLAGFKRGIACVAGLPNHGKSTFLTNIMLGALLNDPNIMIFDISIDDDHEKRMQQFIACLTGLSYLDIASKNISDEKKARIKKATEMILAYIADDRLRMYSDEEEVIDEEDGSISRYSLRDFKTLFATMKEARERYPDRKIYFFVDSWNDMKMEGHDGAAFAYGNEMLVQMKAKCKKFNIGVFLSCHIRKTQGRRPTVEDLKGSSDIYYHAVWIAIAWNEFRENPYKDPIMYKEGNFKYPMLAMQIKKNKSSDWDFDLYYGLLSNSCQLRPIDKMLYESTRTLFNGRK